MKRWYITFSGQAWDEQTGRIMEHAPKFGADEVLVYDDRWLMEQDFYRLNQWLWSAPTPDKMKGFGWFSWKPFILMHALDNFMDEGDVVLFTDGDTYPIAEFSALYARAQHDGGAMFFKAQGCSNAQWIKRDCWLVMGLDPEGRYRWMPPSIARDSQHATARFILIQKGPWKPQQLLAEWLTYCLNPFATTFERSQLLGLADFSTLREHRTEQAIMTLLALKYGFHLYREACQFGNAALEQFGEDAWYPQLFRQEWGAGPREVGPGSKWRNVDERLAQLRNCGL